MNTLKADGWERENLLEDTIPKLVAEGSKMLIKSY
jgi:hypothetical protein